MFSMLMKLATVLVMAVETSSATSPQVDLIPVEKAIVDGTNAAAAYEIKQFFAIS